MSGGHDKTSNRSSIYEAILGLENQFHEFGTQLTNTTACSQEHISELI